MAVVEQAIEDRCDGGGVPEELAPVLDGPVRGEDRAGALVPPHHEFEEVLGGGGRQLTHAEVVDDEQRDGRELVEAFLACAIEDGVGDLLDEDVGLAVEDADALLDRRAADGLRQVALPRAGRPEEEDVLSAVDELATIGPSP
jgi:hypothetical protein